MTTEFFIKSPPVTALIYWKGFIAKLFIETLVILSLAISGALSGVNHWSELTGTQQIIIVCSIVGLAGKNIISLIDKSFANLSAANPNQPPTPPTP